MANAPFDIFVLWQRYPPLRQDILDAYHNKRVYDVLTRQKLIEGAADRRYGGVQYNLGAVATRHGLSVDKADPWRMRYVELIDTPVDQWPAGARQYALDDAAVTQAIYESQEKLRGPYQGYGDLLASQHIHARAHLALYWQTIRGVMTDQVQVARVRSRLMRQLESMDNELAACDLLSRGGLLDHRKSAAPKARMGYAKTICEQIEAQQPNTFARTPTGQVRMTMDALQQAEATLQGQGELLGRLRQLIERRATAALATKLLPRLESDEVRKYVKQAQNMPDWPLDYVERLPVSAPHIIRTRYDELKITGRTGASSPQGRTHRDAVGDGWIGDNLQNLPREGGFRECLVPRPGYKFVVSDWSSAELVALSQVQIDWFGRSTMGQAIRDGYDVHALQACRLLGIPYDRFDKQNPPHKSMRQLSKALNFGFPADMGPARFVAWARAAYGLGLTEAEACAYKAQWKATWPEIRLYQKKCTSMPTSDGKYVVRLPRGGMSRKCAYCEANNFPFQALTALAAKDTLWRVFLSTRSGALRGANQVLFVHDENVLESPTDKAEEHKEILETIMVRTFARWCPDVPIKVESVLADRYGK